MLRSVWITSCKSFCSKPQMNPAKTSTIRYSGLHGFCLFAFVEGIPAPFFLGWKGPMESFHLFEHVKATQPTHLKKKSILRHTAAATTSYFTPMSWSRPAVRIFFIYGDRIDSNVSVNWDKLRVSTLKALANEAPGQTALMETRQRSGTTVDGHKHGANTCTKRSLRVQSARLIFSPEWREAFVYVCNSALQWSQLVNVTETPLVFLFFSSLR